MVISEYITQDNIITAVIFLGIVCILAYVPIRSWLAKRRERRQEQMYSQPSLEKYAPDYIPSAPEIMIPDYNSGYPNGTQNAVEIMKATLKKLDQELQENSQNMQKVLQNVVTMETDIRNKMKSYYEMDQDLKAKEQLLRFNLDALRKAKISILPPNACPACGEETTPIEGTNQFFCYNCYQHKKVKKK